MAEELNHSLLMLNAGSSSLKFKVFANTADLPLLASGQVDSLDSAPQLTVHRPGQQQVYQQTLAVGTGANDALHAILDWYDSHQAEHWSLQAVTHRMVHGGCSFTHSRRLDSQVLESLHRLIPLAPLHQTAALAAIALVARRNAEVVQFACFDTAFHARQAALFTEYALPLPLRQQGIRRFGFHGLSYEWLAYVLQRDAPDLAKGRVVAAHLGNGSSLCALKNGVSIDSSTGMTALAGLPMGTRCGELDPGVVLYLMRQLALPIAEVESILYYQSGLLGLSGLSHDVQRLEASSDARARFALDFYCLKVAQHIAMMAVSLGGMDALVFTGGIGEHSVFVRDAIVQHLAFMQPFAVQIIAADEERMMAMHTRALLLEHTP
ncbi:MAG: acetate kinase [Legionellaceae bacterium]|nr:acetate kinase [Legionellaceae bacterium]